MTLPHLAARVFNTPLLIQRAKLDVILAVLWPAASPAGLQPHAPNERAVPPEGVPGSGIVVLPIHGTLVQRTSGLDALSGLVSYQSLGRSLDRLLADEAVRGIVLDVDSAGGEAAGVFDLADKIRAGRAIKPIVAVANDAAFSAAYALASAASSVWVTRTAGVGSIGVIALHVDQSQRDAQLGYRYTPITAGKHKNDATPHEQLAPEAQAVIQAEVDRLYNLFVDTVAAQRGLAAAAVRATEAALFFGEAAVRAGLADRVGTLDDALAALTAELDSPTAPKEPSPMSTESTAPTGVDLDAARVQARTEAHAHALAIAELCELAGKPELTATYIAQGLSPDAVRQKLHAAHAQAAAPEITSHIAPDAKAPAASLEDNPLIKAVKARAATARKE